MEYFIALHGTSPDSSHIIEAIKSGYSYNLEEKKYFWRQYAAKFWLSIALGLHEVNRKCTIPMLSYQMQEEFNGLSRMGRNYNYLFGVGLDSRSYDRLKKVMISNYLDRLEKIIESRYCIIGFDNYAHVYRGVNLRQDRDTQYMPANFTVVGVTRLPQDRGLTVEPVRLADKISLASLPSDVKDLKPYEKIVSI